MAETEVTCCVHAVWRCPIPPCTGVIDAYKAEQKSTTGLRKTRAGTQIEHAPGVDRPNLHEQGTGVNLLVCTKRKAIREGAEQEGCRCLPLQETGRSLSKHVHETKEAQDKRRANIANAQMIRELSVSMILLEIEYPFLEYLIEYAFLGHFFK